MPKLQEYLDRSDARADDFVKAILPNMYLHVNSNGRAKHGETLLSKGISNVEPLKTILSSKAKLSVSKVDVYGYNTDTWTPITLDKIKVSGNKLLISEHEFVYRGKTYPIFESVVEIPNERVSHVYLYFDIQKGFGEIKLGPWMPETNFRSLIGYYRQQGGLNLIRFVKIENVRLDVS